MAKLQPEQAVELIAKVGAGASLKQTMMDYGYTESSAIRGKASLPKDVQKALVAAQLEANKDLRELGKAATPEVVTDFVKGRLLRNVIDGKDEGVQSAKALGSWREVDMFKSETVSGVIMLAAPQSLNAVRVIDAEVLDCPPMPALPEKTE